MNVIIRADASFQIGTGHIMRCITLADALREKGALVSFICRELPGNLCEYVENKDYKVFRLPYQKELLKKSSTQHSHWLSVNWETDARQTIIALETEKQSIDWLIVDHYGIDKEWETVIRPYVKEVMVIDDLADRIHNCDLLLDQNLYENMESRYKGLVPNGCKLLLGPQHTLLRPEFVEMHKHLRKRNGNIRCILIFFGGSDPTNETAKALKAISMLDRPDIMIDVVVGDINQNKKQIEQICKTMSNANYYCQVDNMASLIGKADLGIGAGGSTMWERCFLGLATITIIVAENQTDTAKSVAEAGAIWNLGLCKNVTEEMILETLNEAYVNPSLLKKMSHNALRVMIGKKGDDTVTDAILNQRRF